MSGKRKPENKKPAKKTLITLSIALSVALVALVIGMQLKATPKKTSDYTATTTDDNSLRRGETGTTLPPSRFSDPFIAETYQVAENIPNVLDSLKCYCFCDRQPFNHKSLLSCYVETHAAG